MTDRTLQDRERRQKKTAARQKQLIDYKSDQSDMLNIIL